MTNKQHNACDERGTTPSVGDASDRRSESSVAELPPGERAAAPSKVGEPTEAEHLKTVARLSFAMDGAGDAAERRASEAEIAAMPAGPAAQDTADGVGERTENSLWLEINRLRIENERLRAAATDALLWEAREQIATGHSADAPHSDGRCFWCSWLKRVDAAIEAAGGQPTDKPKS